MNENNISLDFKFPSKTAEDFFNCSKRNIAWCSGYGAGKTYAACQKALALMCKFPNYRVAVGRYSATELRRTTIQTFFKVCPPELYSEAHGGKRVDSAGFVDLVNKSRAIFMHFDDYDEGALRSLEINSAIVDQAEEVSEQVYLTLDSRVGRWDQAIVPSDLLQLNPKWPRNKFTNIPMAPAYMISLFNPPDEGEFSYLYDRYHPESQNYHLYKHTHQYFESASFDNKALPPEVLATMLTRDAEWVNRYVYGRFSRGEGAIHSISKDSIINPDPEWLKDFLKGAVLARVLDHGATSPTCCTFWASKGGIYVCFMEYYQPDRQISFHRERISELSGDLLFSQNIADPAIFKRTMEKYGGFWTVADEYSDSKIGPSPISWVPGDNNELATRNRINELLHYSGIRKHPVTGVSPAPGIYFVQKSDKHPNGCHHIIRETNSQKKKLLAEINGKKVYGDERETSIADHAYDTLRYFCASHLFFKGEIPPKYKPNSFMAVRNRIIALSKLGKLDRYGMPAT